MRAGSAALSHLLPLVSLLLAGAVQAQEGDLRRGEAAYGDWRDDRPGVRRLIRPQDMPLPGATGSAMALSRIVARPEDAVPLAPEGFEVGLVASGLDGPRTLGVAPNGDIFVAERRAGRVSVLPAGAGAGGEVEPVAFAEGFDYPYGIAFHPPGDAPDFVYVASADRVVRFPYRTGDRRARGPAEPVVEGLPTGGHESRAIAFSPDGSRLYVAVGSRSNAAQNLPPLSGAELAGHEARHGPGAAWGAEEGRAAVLSVDAGGGDPRIFATGIRNCSGLAVAPATGDLWCAVNERDGIGDNLPPDYLSRIGEGKFYGWPWFYIGDHEDPRHEGARPDLAGTVTVPDVLLQPHSAPLGIAFYDAAAFPEDFRGDAFATLHGSWNRAERTGYKVVRAILEDGVPTGEYEDFLTGFVLADGEVWGRPVGVAVDRDGALLVSEDGNGTIWRVGFTGSR